MSDLSLAVEVLPMVAVPPPEENPDNLPFPTHEGEMRIGSFKLRVYQLNTGQRIINADDLNAFFGCTE